MFHFVFRNANSPLIKSLQSGRAISVSHRANTGERQVEIHGLRAGKGFPHIFKGKVTVIQLLGRQPRVIKVDKVGTREMCQ